MNPLIGSSAKETIQNASEALSALIVLMSDRHSDLVRLISPIASAIEHAADSAMLYALADEMRREEGCVTESPELVEQAATRLDEQTVTINELRRQHGELLAALSLIETDKDGDGFICREAMEQVREAIAQAEEGAGQ